VKEQCVIIRNAAAMQAYMNFHIESRSSDLIAAPNGNNPYDSVIVEVEPGIYQRWIAAGAVSTGLTNLGNNKFKLDDAVLTTPGFVAKLDSVKMLPSERKNLCFTFYTKSQLGNVKYNDIIIKQKDSTLQVLGGETFTFEYNSNSSQRTRPEEAVRGNRITLPSLEFSLTPNPADNYVEVLSTAQEECTVRILNLLGQQVFEGKFTGNLKINTSNLIKGSYIVEVKGISSQSFSIQNLIIQ